MNKFLTIKDASIKWNISERSVRNYCARGRIANAVFQQGMWWIPENAKKPSRLNEKPNKNYLLEALRDEKNHGLKGGIYHQIQIDMTFNSNHIEGNKLTHDETRYIFETRTIGFEVGKKALDVDDIIKTINHFRAIGRIIDFANYPLSEAFIKELHKILKTGTADSQRSFFAVGDYKKRPNIVGNRETTPPQLVKQEIKNLVDFYNQKETHSFEEILNFHVLFERIHPFEDGNGRVGRLIAFKECLKNNIVPFIIVDQTKQFYYRGLEEWKHQNGYLIDICKDGQDIVKEKLDYFGIKY